MVAIKPRGEFSPPEDAEKMLSSLLQNLRVPHVVASSQAVPGKLDVELKGAMFLMCFFLFGR